MSNIYYNPPVSQPGSVVRSNGGGGHQVIGFRDVLDARRAAASDARAPSAEYPDGYLGTINSRRSDRLLDTLKNRLTQRSYQRGVHKGEKIEGRDYVWPADLNPMSAIKAQAQGKKWTQQGSPAERLAHGGKVNAVSPEEMLRLQQQYGVDSNDHTQVVNPGRKQSMSGLLPNWK